MERLRRFVEINFSTAATMLKEFDSTLELESLLPIHEGMSTSNYIVTANEKKYLLKIYTERSGNTESSMYAFLQGSVSVPSLLHFSHATSDIPYSFAIIEYIEGTTLNKYIRSKKKYPMELIPQIAGALATIHNKSYARRGFLDAELQVQETFQSVREQIASLLSDKAGGYLPGILRNKLYDFVHNRDDIFQAIESSYVLSHGDFSYSNIMVDQNKKVYLIDFEYSLATNRFRDIGHFFRRKGEDVEILIDQTVYNSFFEIYNSVSNKPLPYNWIQLSKSVDIPAMLALINRDNPPQEWISDIVQDINTFFKSL